MNTVLESIRDTPKWNKDRPRVVVVTKIPERTTVATSIVFFYLFILFEIYFKVKELKNINGRKHQK